MTALSRPLLPRPRWRLVGISEVAKSADLWLPGGFLTLLVGACFVWPLIFPVPPPVGGVAAPNLPPFSAHALLGTDQLGNDVFSRILYGGRVSFEVGLGSAGIGLVIGGSLGVIVAYKGGIVDLVVMRILDVLLAFPSLVLAMVVADFLGASEVHVIWAISFFAIPYFARVARGHTLRLREQTFVLAGTLMGSTSPRLLARHVGPNVFYPLMTFALLGVGINIVVEAALSFLGLGVPPPGPSWGNMIAMGQQNLTAYPYQVIIPVLFLCATVLSLNRLGDALRLRWGVR